MNFTYDQLNQLAGDLLAGDSGAEIIFNDLPENQRNYIVNLIAEIERAEQLAIS